MFILMDVIYFTCWCGDMEEERYLALLGYIKRQKYPAGLTRSKKIYFEKGTQELSSCR